MKLGPVNICNNHLDNNIFAKAEKEPFIGECFICKETTDVISLNRYFSGMTDCKPITIKFDDGSTRVEDNGDGTATFIKTIRVPKDTIPDLIKRLESLPDADVREE